MVIIFDKIWIDINTKLKAATNIFLKNLNKNAKNLLVRISDDLRILKVSSTIEIYLLRETVYK